MTSVYLALGTNIGKRERHLEAAIQALQNHPSIQVKRISSLYETEPVGFLDQAKFLNQVLECQVSLTAKELIQATQAIEKGLGREETFVNGPRIIDIDILIYGEVELNEPELTIPHPRMHLRAFVLIPLSELVPNLVIPGLNRTVETCLNELPKSDLKEVVMK